MNTLQIILYKKRILKFNAKKISKWVKSGNTKNLILAAELGLYDIRKSAIEGLTSLHCIESIPLLKTLLDDPIQSVSESAMKGLEVLTSGNDTDINEKIKAKKKYWKNKTVTTNKLKSSSYLRNISFKNQEKESPGQRLERRLKQQRDANHPPYSF